MTTSVWMKTISLWLVILVLAILNGTLREKTLVTVLGDFSGMVMSGAILSVSIFLVALIATPWYGPLSSRQWLLVGLVWLLLTLVFEFSFGLVVQHKTWAEILDAYTFQGGNIWPVVLLITLLSPWLATKIRGYV